MVKESLGGLKETLGVFVKFKRFFSDNWKIELLIFVLSTISIFLSLSTPLLGKLILDNGVMQRSPRVVFILSALSGLVMLLVMIIQKVDAHIKAYFTRKVKIRLAKNIFRKIGKQSFGDFRNKSVVDCVSKVASDIDSSATVIVSVLPHVVTNVLKIIIISCLVFGINKKVFILIAIYQLVLLARLSFVARMAKHRQKEVYDASQGLTKNINQVFSQLYLMKSSVFMSIMLRKCLHSMSNTLRVEARNAEFNFRLGVFLDILDKVLYWVIAFLSVFFVSKGQLSLGGTGAIMMYVSLGSASWTAFMNMCTRVSTSSLSLERLNEFLEMPPEIEEKKDAKSPELNTGNIEFKDVSFSYANTKNKNIFDAINFRINPGTKIAVVGSSGCGKTTLANLILRVYDVTAGGVFIDGYDVRDLTFKAIHSQISIVPQTLYMWPGTIKDNILYGRRGIEDHFVIEAAKVVQMHSFIEGLSGKYDTDLGDMVQSLSQGQRQRLAIARSILARPKVLILDESFSAVDSNTEEQIIENIKEYLPDSVVIMITHRLSAARKMDCICFIKDAKNVCVGLHEELMDDQVQYAQLFSSQIQSEKHKNIPLPV